MSRLNKIFILFIALMIFTINPTDALSDVFNGSFERSLSSVHAPGWQGRRGTYRIRTSSVSGSGFGRKYLEVSGEHKAVSSQMFYVTPGRLHTVSLMIKEDSESVRENTAVVAFKFFDSSGTPLDESVNVPGLVFSNYLNKKWTSYINDPEPLSTHWQEWHKSFFVPREAVAAKIYLYNWDVSTKTLWDNIQVVQGPATLVPNGDFEKGAPHFFVGNFEKRDVDNVFGKTHVRVRSGKKIITKGLISIKGGQSYTLSTLVKVESGYVNYFDGPQALVGLKIYRQDGSEILRSDPEDDWPKGLNWSRLYKMWYSTIGFARHNNQWNYWHKQIAFSENAARAKIGLYAIGDQDVLFDLLSLSKEKPNLVASGHRERIINSGNMTTARAQTELFSVHPNTRHRLGLVVSEDPDVDVGSTASVGIIFYDSSGRVITPEKLPKYMNLGLNYSTYLSPDCWYYSLSRPQLTDKNQQYTLSFTSPPNAAMAQILFHRLNTSTSISISELSIREDPVANKINNGSFEFGFNQWRPLVNERLARGRIEIIPESNAYDGGFHVRINSHGHYSAIKSDNVITLSKNEPHTVSFSVRGSSDFDISNPAAVAFEFVDKNGDPIESSISPTGLTYSSYLKGLWYKYIKASNISTSWRHFSHHFFPPQGTHSARLYIYKLCSSDSCSGYIEVDQVTLTKDLDKHLIPNSDFELSSGTNLTGWTGDHEICQDPDTGRACLQIKGQGNSSRTGLLPIKGGSHYVFHTRVKEKINKTVSHCLMDDSDCFDSQRSALFALDVYDAEGNILRSHSSDGVVTNMNWSQALRKWYSYIGPVPWFTDYYEDKDFSEGLHDAVQSLKKSSWSMVLDSFQPADSWRTYARVFSFSKEARFVRLHLYNWNHVTSTLFDNVTLQELDYKSSEQTGFKSAIVWFLNPEPSHIPRTLENWESILPFIAYVDEQGTPLDWLFDAVILYPTNYRSRQSKQVWENFLHQIFVSNLDLDDRDSDGITDESWFEDAPSWLSALTQSLGVAQQYIGNSRGKIKIYITIPTTHTHEEKGIVGFFDETEFGDVDGDRVSEDATQTEDQKKILGWYIDTVIDLWDALPESDREKIELVGFHWLHEVVSGSQSVAMKFVSDHLKKKGLRLSQSPYNISKNKKAYYPVKMNAIWSEYFDVHFFQPNYTFTFKSLPYLEPQSVENSFVLAGITNNAVNLELDINKDRYQHYLDVGRKYGAQEKGMSTIMYEVAGWLYSCALLKPEHRSAYDEFYRYVSGQE